MKTTEQILEQNGLNWNVVKKPLFTYDMNEKDGFHEVNDTPYYGIVREDTDEVFTTCKAGYTPTQNETIIDTMQEIAGENDLEIIKAIPINEGRKIVVQMKRPNNRIIIGGQDTDQFIYAINSHDGTSSLKFGFMNTVIFCQNQFGWLSGNAMSGYRHTESIQDKVKNLPQIINFTDQEKRIADLQEFSIQHATKDLINDTIDYLSETDLLATATNPDIYSSRKLNIRNDIKTCIHMEMNRVGHNKWGLFNGVTRYTTHGKSVPKRDNGRQESLLIGSGRTMNEKAFNFLKEN
jgi:hypothetical protein